MRGHLSHGRMFANVRTNTRARRGAREARMLPELTLLCARGVAMRYRGLCPDGERRSQRCMAPRMSAQILYCNVR